MKRIAMTDAIWKILTAARSTDKARLALHNINIRPDSIEATDGGRLIRVKRGDTVSIPEDVTPGVYRVITLEKMGRSLVGVIVEPEDAQYPETDRVIPEHTDVGNKVSLPTKKNKKERDMALSRAIIDIYVATGRTIRAGYLEDLTPLDADWRLSKPKESGPAGAIRMEAEGVTAVLMGMKEKKER